MQPLTSTERSVIAAAARGFDVSSTATALGRSIDTVKQHRSRAMSKLGAKTMAHAVALAIAQGLVDVLQRE